MITDEQIRHLQRKWVYVLCGNENDVHGLIPFARELIALAQQVKPLTDEQIKQGILEADPAGEDLCRWSFAAGIAFAEKAHGIGGE